MASDLQLSNREGEPPSWPLPAVDLSVRPEPTATPDGGEFRSLIAMLRRRRGTILFGLFSVFTAVAVTTYFWPKTYESSAVLLVEDPGEGPASPAFAILERMGRTNQIDTEVELLRSRHVLARVVDELDLHVSVLVADSTRRPRDVFPAFEAGRAVASGEYRIEAGANQTHVVWDAEADTIVTRSASPDIQFGGLSVTLPDDFATPLTVNTTLFDRAVNETRDLVSAGRVRLDADLVGVFCQGTNPRAAQELCATALTNYVLLRTNLQRAEATTTADFLRGQVERLAQRLTDAENELERYKRRNSIVALNDRATAEVQEITRLRAHRDALDAERVALSELIRSVETGELSTRRYRDLASFPTFLMNDAVTEILVSLVDLENRRSELGVHRTDRNVDLVALDTRIGDIESQLRSLAVSYERSLTEQVRSLDSTLARTNRNLAAIPTQQVESARLERQAGLIEDLYRLLETRLREAEVAEAVNLPSVRIVDPASKPFKPSAPNVMMNLALGLFLGLAYGLAMALYREFKDPVHERDEVARETGLPVLGMIPRLRRPGPLMQISVQNRGAHHGTQLPAKKNRQAGEAALEAIRGLAAELSFVGSTLHTGSLQSVAVTGASRGEGKTFTACNLALLRASHGAKTLLIDGDMRARSVAGFFGLPTASPGLSDVLTGGADLAEVWQRVGVDGSELWVIPAGTPSPHAVPLLESAAFKTLLARAVRYFDLVVIDTPPVSVTTDAATVAAQVNAVVLVVRGGVTDRAALDLTMERLRRARGNVVGVVINDIAVPSAYLNRYAYPEPVKGT